MRRRRINCRHVSRRGIALRTWLLAIVAIGIAGAVGYHFVPQAAFSTPESGPTMYRVDRAEFLHEITERGTVESSSNVEIRCEVQPRGNAGTTILEIIPEGTYVEEGDVIAILDSATLETDRTRQQIVVNNSLAAVTKAKNDYETAEIALEEYLEGRYEQDRQTLEADLAKAEENLRRAEDWLEHSERLFAKGFVTQVSLEGDQFAVTEAKNARNVVVTKLRVLEEYTKPKTVKQLESDIATTYARYRSEEHSHELDVEQLELIEEQIAKCTLRAPSAGQVVYANETDRRGGSEVIIEEGTQVRERQVIVRLPDPQRMQVRTRVNEARVSMVRPGQTARMRVEAFPDLELYGSVVRVNEYPAPTSWWASTVREYETIVRIDNPPEGMRPGLTAEVRILIERLDDAVQVPVQAVFEHLGRHYCVIRNGREFEAVPVDLGSTNDTTVVIRGGVDVGQQVVHNASAFRERVDNLPDVPRESGPRQPPGELASGDGGEDGTARADDGGVEGTPVAASQDPPRGGPAGTDPDALFARLDSNGDGRIEIADLNEPFRGMLASADTNGDGFINRSEFTAAMASLRREGGGPGGGGGSGGPRADGGPGGTSPAARQAAGAPRGTTP